MNTINTNWNRTAVKLQATSCKKTNCLPQSFTGEGKLTLPVSRSVEPDDMTNEHNNLEHVALLREMLYFDRF